MNFESVDAMRRSEFEGFKSMVCLQKSECCEVPAVPGVYLVLRSNIEHPSFLQSSTGGHFKGKDPTVEIEALKSKWVRDVPVLYIGKAGSIGGVATLRSRLRQYMQFGKGTPIGHWGGRYIWQLQDSPDLLICWKPTNKEIPREVEKGLIREFRAVYKRLPFANIVC